MRSLFRSQKSPDSAVFSRRALHLLEKSRVSKGSRQGAQEVVAACVQDTQGWEEGCSFCPIWKVLAATQCRLSRVQSHADATLIKTCSWTPVHFSEWMRRKAAGLDMGTSGYCCPSGALSDSEHMSRQQGIHPAQKGAVVNVQFLHWALKGHNCMAVSQGPLRCHACHQPPQRSVKAPAS